MKKQRVIRALVSMCFLCGLVLIPAANLSADDAGEVTGETVVIEPAGTGNWQEMLDHEAAYPSPPEPQMALPHMPAPLSRELPGVPAQPGPVAPPPPARRS